MKQYIVDAFAEKLFEGNPAAVCILESYPADELLQQITTENGLSETAFLVKEKSGYHLRWFTPGGEIDLCGHATLASAYVIMNFVETDKTEIHFFTQSGELIVTKKDELYEMDFPPYEIKPVEVTDEMEKAIGFRPVEAWLGRDLVCVMENEKQVLTAQPNLEKVIKLDGLLLNITAIGIDYDIVSRTFSPKCNVPEDPVCGSGHCNIIPYWVNKLHKTELVARQASNRGGTLYCRMENNRIFISGKAVLYAVSEVNIDI